MSDKKQENEFEGVNYYVVIHAQVLHDNRLTPLARLIYGEVSALANIHGYAWISNGKLAEKYQVSKTTISTSISKLQELGYLRSEIFYKPNSKEVEKRNLYITPIQENLNRVFKKTLSGYEEKFKDPMQENLKENNTLNNTVNNSSNNNYINNKENPEENSKGKIQQLITLFEQEMGQISPTAIEELRFWLFDDKYDFEMIKMALRESVLNGKVTMKYIKAILRNWRQDGVKTPSMVKEREVERFSAKPSEEFYIPLDGPWNGTEN